VRHVAIFGDYFQPLDGFGVTDYVVEVDRAVFFDPVDVGQRSDGALESHGGSGGGFREMREGTREDRSQRSWHLLLCHCWLLLKRTRLLTCWLR